MSMPRLFAGAVAGTSLCLTISPVLAGKKKSVLPNAPMPSAATLAVYPDAQGHSFSIRTLDAPRPVVPAQAGPPERPIIAIGRALKADAAIFSRLAPERKEVSDASSH